MPELVKTKEPSRNTPKRDPSGNQLIPGNFEIITFALSNASDKNLDIRNLVDSFSITEELFSPVVTFTATLRDTENFFETFPLVGQERLIINIVKNDPVTGKRQGQQKAFRKAEGETCGDYPRKISIRGRRSIK